MCAGNCFDPEISDKAFKKPPFKADTSRREQGLGGMAESARLGAANSRAKQASWSPLARRKIERKAKEVELRASQVKPAHAQMAGIGRRGRKVRRPPRHAPRPLRSLWPPLLAYRRRFGRLSHNEAGGYHPPLPRRQYAHRRCQLGPAHVRFEPAPSHLNLECVRHAKPR